MTTPMGMRHTHTFTLGFRRLCNARVSFTDKAAELTLGTEGWIQLKYDGIKFQIYKIVDNQAKRQN